MIKLNKIIVFYLLALAYIFANSYILLFKRDMFYPFNMVPLVLLVVYWSIYHVERVVYLMVFSTPLAVTLKDLGLSEGINLSLPTEPLMAGLMVIYLLNEFMYKITPKKILNHPLTIIILIQLGWTFFTTIFSENPVISIKFLIARMWFVFSCYFITTQMFKNKKNIVPFILAYAIPLAIVCLITTYRHAAFNFDDKIADWIVSPFYNDHTAYGAACAFYIPIMVALLFQTNVSNFNRAMYITIAVILSVGLGLSFARGGWLSIATALAILLSFMMRLKLKPILISLAIVLAIVIPFQDEIFIALGRNNTDSEGNLSNTVSSITNISTDASNLERINRWNCAIRMFYERPLTGWGPGTYMFYYAPFQKSSERTIISTNFGTNGNAHSEYLGPLSEQGILGLIIVACLFFGVLSLGYRLYYSIKDYNTRVLLCGVFLGLFPYFIHGFLNNFLDTDKLSVPFWGFMAIMVCIDVYHRNGNTEDLSALKR